MLRAHGSIMQTLHGIHFMPVLRVRGTLLGLDARWGRARGLALVLLLTLITPSGPLHATINADIPMPAAIGIGLSSVLALLVTSLGHELGHALAGRLAGLHVRAIVLAPEGGVTIRASSDHPHVNFRTALAGPLANAIFAAAFAVLACVVVPNTFASSYLNQVGAMQLLTALANLLPYGPLDGSTILSAWRAFRGAV